MWSAMWSVGCNGNKVFNSSFSVLELLLKLCGLLFRGHKESITEFFGNILFFNLELTQLTKACSKVLTKTKEKSVNVVTLNKKTLERCQVTLLCYFYC